MKTNILFLFTIVITMLASCSSDTNVNQTIDSNIIANGMTFVPNSVNVSNGIASIEGESALIFSLLKGTIGNSNYENISFKINYPLTLSSAPSGTYEFGIGETGTMLFAQGSYVKGSISYSLAGYSVKVTALGNDKFKLEFQNIEAVNISNGSVIIISGYCEGKF